MGRNAARRRAQRDAELAAVGGKTRHVVKVPPRPGVAGRRSTIHPGLMVAAMAAWGAVRK